MKRFALLSLLRSLKAFQTRSIAMTPNPSQVIVLPEDHTRAHTHALWAHHREIPEVRGEGSSPKDAAERLVELLSLTLDNAASDWHREIILQAIVDVRAVTECDCA
jgi:hypothetical protein